MSAESAGSLVETAGRTLLERRLGTHITHMEVEPLATRSTHAIGRWHLRLSTGRRTTAICKQLLRQPGRDPGREVHVYRRLLTGGRFGAPLLYASRSDDRHGEHWLLMEDVGGWRLDWSDTSCWESAFEWLAVLHAEHHGRAARRGRIAWLGEHGEEFAVALAGDARANLERLGRPANVARFDRLASRWLTSTLAHLAVAPRTLVHGDASGHNLMVARREAGRIRPIDWEWAALAPAAWDVEKLLAGWGDDKPRLLSVYAEAFAHHAGVPLDRPAFELDLGHCTILRMLWYLRWWIDDCDDPAFVEAMLEKMAKTWQRLERDAGDRVACRDG